MASRAEVDANGQYIHRSKPTVPRAETPDVRIKFVALHQEHHHIKEEKLSFNSQTNLYRVREVIRRYFETCFEKDFIFLRNQQEIPKSKETTTKLWQILPVVPSFLIETRENKQETKKIFSDFKNRHGFENVGYKTLSVSTDGKRQKRMCVLLVFLYENNGLTNWPQDELKKQLNGLSLKSFTYYPSTIMSAKHSITESNIEKIISWTVTGDIDQIKKLLKHSKERPRSFIDYRGATPLHYAARHGHLHLCEYFMVQYESDLHIKDTLDINNRSPLNHLLTYLDVLGTDVDKRTFGSGHHTPPHSTPTSLNNTKENTNSKKNENIIKMNDNLNGVIKKLKQEQNIPMVIQKRLDVVVYLLTQKSNKLHKKDSSGYSCLDRIFTLADKYKTYLLRRLDPCFIDKDLVLHFTEFALHNSPTHTIDRETLMKYVKELVPSEPYGMFSPLHLAAFNNDAEVIDVLLKNGHDQSKKDANGLLPFHYACQKGHQSSIMPLCFENIEDEDILTGIKWHFQTCFCKSKDFGDVFTRILQIRPNLIAEMDPDFQMTVISCMENKIPIIHWTELLPLIDQQRQHRFLSQAACIGSYKVVKYLLNAGVDVNVKDFMGRTALHEAMFSGHSDIVNLLLSEGADPNSVDNRHSTPLHYACIATDADCKSLESSRYIYGYFSSKQMSDRITSCMEALTNHDKLEYNIPDICGRTPLLNAIHFKRLGIFKWLLQNQFDKLNIFRSDISGHNILHYLPIFNTEILDFIFPKLNSLMALTRNDDSPIPIWEFDFQSDEHTSSYWNILRDEEVQSNIRTKPEDTEERNKRFFLKTFHNRDQSSRYQPPQPLLPHIVVALSSKQDQLLQRLLETCPLLTQDRHQMVMAGLTAVKLWNLDVFQILYTYGNYCLEDMASFLFLTVANIPLQYQAISALNETNICKSFVPEKYEAKQLDLVKFLIARGASPNFLVDTGNGKQTVLEVAVISTNIKIVEILLDHATVYGCFSALIAALQGNKEMLRLLLSRAENEMGDDHVIYIISPEIIEMRSSNIMMYGLVKAACCSTKCKRSILKCILEYFPTILSEKRILTRKMVTKIRDDKILVGNGFLFEPRSPISSLMIANRDGERCAEITRYMLKAGLYMQGVRVSKRKHKTIHLACDSFRVAVNLKRWDCLIKILESSGDVIWRCLLFKSNTCMYSLHWEAEHTYSFYFRETEMKRFKNVVYYYMHKILHSNIDVVVAFVHSGRTFLRQLNRGKQDEIRHDRHISISETNESVNDIFVELLRASMTFFGHVKSGHFDKAFAALKLSFALTEVPDMDYYRNMHFHMSTVKKLKINTNINIASKNMHGILDLPPSGVSMALSWFSNEDKNVNATTSNLSHLAHSELPLVYGNADTFDEIPWYMENSITRPYKDNTTTNKWKAFTDSTNIAKVLQVRKFGDQKLHVSHIKVFDHKYKSSNVQMIMTRKKVDTMHHKSSRKIFKTKYTSSQMKSLMTVRSQVNSIENMAQTALTRRSPRFLPKRKELTTDTLLTEKKFALHKLKNTRLVSKIKNTVPRIYGKRKLNTYHPTTFERYINLQCQSFQRGDDMPFLHMASAAGDLGLLEHYFKLEGPQNINKKWNGFTPIVVAASQLQIKSVQFLLNNGANFTEDILFHSCNASVKGYLLWNGHQLISDEEMELGKLDMAEFLIKRHCRIDYNESGMTCVDVAIQKELWKLTEFLIDHNCEPDFQHEGKRWYVLDLMKKAEDHLCEKMLKIIINKSSETTPVMITDILNTSTKRRSPIVLGLVMQQLVFPLHNDRKGHLNNILHKTVCGEIILKCLSIRGMTSVIKTFLSLVNHKDEYLNKETNMFQALHMTLQNGHFETAELLLLNGFQLYQYRYIKSGYFVCRLSNEQQQLRDRVKHLLMLEQNADKDRTSILHSAAAFGDCQTIGKILNQPFVDVMTSIKYPNLYTVVAVNHQNETFEMCINTTQHSIGIGITDNGGSLVISFLSTLVQKHDILRYRQKQLNSTEVDSLYTYIEKQFYGNTSYHDHRKLSDNNTVRFLKMIDVKINNDIMVLFALIGKPWIIDVLQKWCTVGTLKDFLSKKLVGPFSFLDIHLLCTVSTTYENDNENREAFLRKVLSLQNDIEISNLSLHSLYLDRLTHLAGIILLELQRHQRNLTISDGWIKLFYRAISNNDLAFVKTFCTQEGELKTLIVHIGVCISLQKKNTEIASYLLGRVNIDVLKPVKLPRYNRTTTILECFGKVGDHNFSRGILKTMVDNKPTLKDDLKDVACQYICRSGSVSFLETMFSIFGNIRVTFNDLLIAVTAVHEELAVALIKTDKYLNFNTLQLDTLSRIVQIACRYNMTTFVEVVIKKLQDSDIKKIVAATDTNDFNTLDITKLMGHIDLYFTLKSYCQLTLKHYTDDEIYIGWFKYLMRTNESDIDSLPRQTITKNLLPAQIAEPLRVFIDRGDDKASRALLQTGQEMIISKMNSQYSKNPYIHLLTYSNCSKSLQTLIDLCTEANINNINSLLDSSIEFVQKINTDPLSISILEKSLECFKILWSINSNRKQVSKDGDTLLHLAVASGITEIIEIVNNAVDVNVRVVTNKTGYTPAMIAASMGRHDIIPLLVKGLDSTDIFPDNHQSHNIMEHTCLACLLDLSIGWSKLYQKSIHNHEESTAIPLRSVTKDITENRLKTTSVNKLYIKWTKSAFSSFAQIIELHDNSFENRLSSCILQTEGYGSCSVEEARLVSEHHDINEVIAMHDMTDIALQVTEHEDYATSVKLLTEVLMHCIQFGNLKTIQSILDRELPNNSEFSKIVKNPTDIEPNKSLFVSALSLGRLDIASYFLSKMDDDGKLFVLAELEKIKEALPLITLMFCGIRNPGDQQWHNNSDYRFNDSDTLQILPRNTPYIVNIESRALLESILPNKWLGKTLNIDMDQFSKRSTGWSNLRLRNMLVTHVLKRYASLFSVESPAWKNVDQIIVKCVDEKKDLTPSLQVINKSIIDTVQVKDDLSGKFTYFVTNNSVPLEISVDQESVQRLKDIVIPDIEDQFENDIGIRVKIAVDWSKILTQDSNGNRAILKAMNHDPYSQLGGLHVAVSNCSTMISTMTDWYNKGMVENVINLLRPLKEIQVRYVSELSGVVKHDFSKMGPIVYWDFTINENHVHYNIECFPVYEIIRTCFVGYQNVYGLAVELQHFKDDCLSRDIYRINETRYEWWRYYGCSSQYRKKETTQRVLFNIDWTSFGYLGHSIKKYFANSLNHELQKVVATRSWYSHIPMLVNTITLSNAHRYNVGVSYSNSDQTLHIQVMSVKQGDSQWKVEGLHLDETLTMLERQQILTADMSDLFRNIEKISNEEMVTSTNIARINVSQSAFDEISVQTRAAGMYHLVTKDSLWPWFEEQFQRHNTMVINHLILTLESSPCCVYLGDYDVAFGIWTDIAEAEVTHSIKNNKDTYQMYMGYSCEPAQLYLLNTVDGIKPTSCMFWKWQPIGSRLCTDGSMNLISINKKLYLTVDCRSVQNILGYLPKFSYPVVPFATEKLMFKSQGFYSKDKIHENDLLKLITSSASNTNTLRSPITCMWIFKLWQLCLNLGIRLHIDLESICQHAASSTDVTLGLVARAMWEFISSLPKESIPTLVNLKLIALGGVMTDDLKIFCGKDATQNINIAVTSSSSVCIQVYSYDNADEITDVLKCAFAYLGAQHLAEELVACFANNKLPVEVNIHDLKDPTEFEVYVENVFVLLDVVSAVIHYIVKHYPDPKPILLKNSKTISVNPNPSFENMHIFLYKKNVLHIAVPQFVITKTIHCIDSILTKYDQSLSYNADILFEPVQLGNKIMGSITTYPSQLKFWIKYRNISVANLDQESIERQLKQQLKVAVFENDRFDNSNVIAVSTKLVDDETLELLVEVSAAYIGTKHFIQIELSTYKHKNPKRIHEINWSGIGNKISRQTLVTGENVTFCVRRTCDCHNISKVYHTNYRTDHGQSHQLNDKVYYFYVSDIKLTYQNKNNKKCLPSICCIQASSEYKVFSMTSQATDRCSIKAECISCEQTCKFLVWFGSTDELSICFQPTDKF